jgi:hypothetical protein
VNITVFAAAILLLAVIGAAYTLHAWHGRR